ncbi:MAG: adenosine-specific kinase [bacterium]
MPLQTVKIENPQGVNMIMGQSHFIRTLDDIHEILVGSIPEIQFGLAFNKAPGPRMIQHSGNDDRLVDLAKKNADRINAQDTFVLFMNNAFPIHVMKALKHIPEISNIYCATSHQIEVLVIENECGRGVMGLVDDYAS